MSQHPTVVRRRFTDFEEAPADEKVYEAVFVLNEDEKIVAVEPHGIGSVVVYTVEEL